MICCLPVFPWFSILLSLLSSSLDFPDFFCKALGIWSTHHETYFWPLTCFFIICCLSDKEGRQVFVGGLLDTVNENVLRAYFSQYGPIDDVQAISSSASKSSTVLLIT